MNAQDFKREMEELRREHDEAQQAAKAFHDQRDQQRLMWIAQAAHDALKAGETELKLDDRYGVLSDHVMTALADSGCHVRPIEGESILTNNTVVKGYVITWYPKPK
jgi:hypothetical protein